MKVNLGRYNTGKQRRELEVKIHEWDTWCADNTLARIIHPLIVQLKKDKSGIPGQLCPYVEGESDEEGEKRMEEARKRWEEILDKIIFAMRSIATGDDGDEPWYKRMPGKTRKQMMERMHERLFKNLPYTEEEEEVYKRRNEHVMEHSAKVQEGCELLGKYFRNLWT
jgi:hypothetical protein